MIKIDDKGLVVSVVFDNGQRLDVDLILLSKLLREDERIVKTYKNHSI